MYVQGNLPTLNPSHGDEHASRRPVTRHNIRVRGLPESVMNEQLEAALLTVFNGIIDRLPDSPINMERFHRSLGPRRAADAPPRVVVCCLVNYPLKQDIIRRARDKEEITYSELEIQLSRFVKYYTPAKKGIGVPSDLPQFCEDLHLPRPALPDWVPDLMPQDLITFEESNTPTDVAPPRSQRQHRSRRRMDSHHRSGSPRDRSPLGVLGAWNHSNM